MATFTELTGSANRFSGVDVGYRSAPTFADIDSDGDLDAFVGTNTGPIRYYQNNGGTFTELTGTANPLNGVVGMTNSDPTFADIDSDGDLDAFVGSEGGTISYYQNTGGTFTQLSGTANPLNGVYVGYLSSPTFADIDSDGDLDAFVGADPGTISYYQNNGGTFTQISGTANPLNGVDVGYESSPTFVDIDSDGDLDAFVGAYDGTIHYYQNGPTAPVNTPPVANADTVSANQNTAINISVATLLANDTDANNDPLSITGVSNPTGGTAVLNNNGTPTNSADDFITFTPTTGFSGNASFNYSLSDGKGGSSSASVTVAIGGTQMGTNGNDTLTGNAGNDSLNGGNGDDILTGNAGNDTLMGDNGNDLIFGNAGDDLLNGGNGEDTLRGGLGTDILTGGNGKDVFVFASGEGTDTITDFSLGNDKIGLPQGLTFGNLSFSGNQIRVGSEVLAVLTGVNTNTLTASNFVAV
jgi:Ca2+-binding RTX toxin-like protein